MCYFTEVKEYPIAKMVRDLTQTGVIGFVTICPKFFYPTLVIKFMKKLF